MRIKISAFCIECQEASGNKKVVSVEEIVEFNDENLYEVVCEHGHKCYARLQEEKFELLFDQGAMALIDGYSRESVASFATSLERFIEFYLKVIAVHHNVKLDNFSNTWKLMAKQSERQLGAFYFIQACEWGKVLFPLNENRTQFRNKVIHQGYIPSTNEAIDFGDYVLNFITNVLNKLKESHNDSLSKSTVYNLLNSGEMIPGNSTNATASVPTIIGLRSNNIEEIGRKRLKDAIDALVKNNFYKDFYIRQILD